MSFKDMLAADLDVFVNPDEFGEEHLWNGKPITIVTDYEKLMNRKFLSPIDTGWFSELADQMFFVKEDAFNAIGMKPAPDQTVMFDRKQRRVLVADLKAGMYTIVLTGIQGGVGI